MKQLAGRCFPPARYSSGSCNEEGITLIEVLVAVVILGLLSIGLTSFLNVQLFESLRYEQATRETDDASRVQHLIETEVSESDDIVYGVSLPPACGSGNLLFALDVAEAGSYDASTGLPVLYRTFYYQNSGALLRCGKPVCPSGNLKFTAQSCDDAAAPTSEADVSSLITANIRLDVVSSGSSAEVLHYQLIGQSGKVVFDGKAYGQAEIIR
jgi:hypothetical protein